MREMLARLIADAPMSKSALARRAGVSPSTITRIAAGELDPSLSVGQKVLSALGFQIPDQLPQLCDVAAVHAARRIIRGDTRGGVWEDALERWATSFSDFVLEAGRAAPLRLRSEARVVNTSWSPLRIYGAIAATGHGWVASGWPAGAMLGAREALDQPLLVYVQGGAASLGLAISNESNGPIQVRILPFDGVSELGAVTEQGIPWADPYQVCLDLCADEATETIGLQLLDELERDNV